MAQTNEFYDCDTFRGAFFFSGEDEPCSIVGIGTDFDTAAAGHTLLSHLRLLLLVTLVTRTRALGNAFDSSFPRCVGDNYNGPDDLFHKKWENLLKFK